MTSHLTRDFRSCFEHLSERVQRVARQNYKLWKDNPRHPGLDFKKVSQRNPTYAVRIGIGWRALGYKQSNTMIWFWIGSHADYDKLLRQL